MWSGLIPVLRQCLENRSGAYHRLQGRGGTVQVILVFYSFGKPDRLVYIGSPVGASEQKESQVGKAAFDHLTVQIIFPFI